MEPTHLNPKPATDIDYDAIGRATYEASCSAMDDLGIRPIPDVDPTELHTPWNDVDADGKAVWTSAGRAAVEAYDAQLTGLADAKAAAVLDGPETWAQGLADGTVAMDPDGTVHLVRDEAAYPGQPGAGDMTPSVAQGAMAEPDPAENPADAFAKAQEIERRNGGHF